MTQMGDDIHEIKSDVKELKAIVQQALIKQAINGQRLDSMQGKITGIIAFALALVSWLSYAAWDYIKAKAL